jgi:hypothetical protein
MTYLRNLIPYTLIFVIMGCVTPHVKLDRAVIRNDTRNSISDVMVRHEPTGKTARINRILPLRSFDLGFSGKPMLGKQAIITWREADGRERKEHLDLPYDWELKSERENMTLIYIIHSSGRATVHLENSDTGIELKF